MAKLTVSLDTETQEVAVTVDGVPIENVQCVSISNYGCYYDYEGMDKFHFSVSTYEKVGDVTKSTSFYASKKENTVASEKYKGLFEKEEAKASLDFEIKNYLPIPQGR